MSHDIEPIEQSALSAEVYQVPVIADADPVGLTVEFAWVDINDDPAEPAWEAGSWVSDGAGGALQGPGREGEFGYLAQTPVIGPLAVGVYGLWIRVTDDVGIPVYRCDIIDVFGSSTTGEVSSSTPGVKGQLLGNDGDRWVPVGPGDPGQIVYADPGEDTGLLFDDPPIGGPGGTTDLAVANVTGTTLDVTSSTGDPATLPAATTDDAGLMTAAQFDDLAALVGHDHDAAYDALGAAAAAQVAAEATAAGALSAHEAAGNPHPGYLTGAEGDAAYDALGAAAAAQSAAAAALSAHEGAGDPHSGYLTPAEGNAAYDVLGAAAAAQAAAEATAAGALASHTGNTSNPHSVTLTQAVAADGGTDVTAEELETLTNGSNADSEHTHGTALTPDEGTIIGRRTGQPGIEAMTYAEAQADGLGGGGSGDVVGPASATDGNFVLWDGPTGKLVKDEGFAPSDFQAALVGLSASLAQAGGVDNWIVHRAAFTVIDRLDTPPGSPADLDTYLIIDTATGDWTGREDQVARWNDSGSEWLYTNASAIDGTQLLYVEAESALYRWDGTAWVRYNPPTPVRDVTGTAYTVTAADNGWLLRFTDNSLVTVDLPAGLPVEFGCDLVSWGTAGMAVQDDGSSTVHKEGAVAQYEGVSAVVVDTDTWSAVGPLV